MVPNFSPTLEELRRSISALGVQNEVFFLHGLCIDGAKRLQVCSELGITAPERQFLTPEDAAPALWIRHPERAARLFPCDTISQAAELYKTDLAAVSPFFAKEPPIQREAAYWRTYDARREVQHRGLRWPPTLWKQAGKVASRKGWTRSHLIRVAVAFALDNMDQIGEFDRLFGGKLRQRQGPKGASGPKKQKRARRPKLKKWAGQE